MKLSCERAAVAVTSLLASERKSASPPAHDAVIFSPKTVERRMYLKTMYNKSNYVQHIKLSEIDYKEEKQGGKDGSGCN